MVCLLQVYPITSSLLRKGAYVDGSYWPQIPLLKGGEPLSLLSALPIQSLCLGALQHTPIDQTILGFSGPLTTGRTLNTPSQDIRSSFFWV